MYATLIAEFKAYDKFVHTQSASQTYILRIRQTARPGCIESVRKIRPGRILYTRNRRPKQTCFTRANCGLKIRRFSSCICFRGDAGGDRGRHVSRPGDPRILDRVLRSVVQNYVGKNSRRFDGGDNSRTDRGAICASFLNDSGRESRIVNECDLFLGGGRDLLLLPSDQRLFGTRSDETKLTVYNKIQSNRNVDAVMSSSVRRHVTHENM